MLKKILIGLLVVLFALTIAIAFQPASFSISSKETITTFGRSPSSAHRGFGTN
jgi:hypothetical protein